MRILLLAVVIGIFGCTPRNRGTADVKLPEEETKAATPAPIKTNATPAPVAQDKTAPKSVAQDKAAPKPVAQEKTADTAGKSGSLFSPGVFLVQSKLPDPGDYFAQPQKKPDPPDPKKPKPPVDPADLFPPDKKPGDPVDPKKNKPEGPSATTKLYGKMLDQWIDLISSPDPSKAEPAIKNVLAYGPDLARKAVPKLNSLLEKYYTLDVHVKIEAIAALGLILDDEYNPDPKDVKKAVENLITLMKFDTNANVKYQAAEALGNLGPAAVSAIPQLKIAVGDAHSWKLREAACYALGRVGYDKEKGPNYEAIHLLFGRLKEDKAFQVRLAAIQSLTFLGPPKIPAHRTAVKDALAKAGLNDVEPTVKIWAHMSLMSLDGKTNAFDVGKIASFIQHNDVMVRLQAVQALCILGKDSKTEVMQLVAALEDQEKIVAAWAVLALARLEKEAAPAESHLKKIVADKEWPQPLKDIAQQTIDFINGKTPAQTPPKVDKEKEKDVKAGPK